jgi:hypothetical protein
MVKQNMGLTLNQEIFIGITFIVIIIIMILVKDKIMAILIVGLVANFLAISSQLILINERHLKHQTGSNGLENQTNANGFENKNSYLIDQSNSGYGVYREPCGGVKKSVLPTKTNNYNSYDGKIDDVEIVKNKFSKLLDTNNIGYNSDMKAVREQLLRTNKMNPVNSDRELIRKYIIPEVIAEENKPWWG